VEGAAPLLDKLAKVRVSSPMDKDRRLILRDDSDLVEAVMDPKLSLRNTQCLGTTRGLQSTRWGVAVTAEAWAATSGGLSSSRWSDSTWS
jgi:hypothetical protein